MSDYIPTTKEVRKIYADYRDDIRDGDRDPSKSYPLSGHEFDRWLTEVIRKSKEEAWDEGWASETFVWNPYREGEK